MPGKNGRITETSDFVAFLKRVLTAYGDRIGDDPAALVHLRDIEQTLRDAVNRGVFLATQAADNGQPGYSQAEIGRILGVSQQAMSKRARLGETAHIQLQQLRGAGAVIRIGDVRAQRAEALAAAEVPDRTGSERERGAYLRAV